jgi:molybdopterin molybdotransferase
MIRGERPQREAKGLRAATRGERCHARFVRIAREPEAVQDFARAVRRDGVSGDLALLSVDEAQTRILAGVAPLTGVERVPLARACGRVAAEHLRARLDLPPADHSAMDGYAVRLADLAAAEGRLPVTIRAVAGAATATLARGEAALIFTGANLPHGADTVVRLEDCDVVGREVRVRASDVRRGDHVRRAGEDVRRGTSVWGPGFRLRPQDVGLAASLGVVELAVRHPPRVAVLVTGDELVEPGRPLTDGRIYDSNGPMLAALLEALGCRPGPVARVVDTLDGTRAALQDAARHVDLLVTTGGVSVGEEDHVKAAVRDLGDIALWGVAAKPGKPLGFGQVAGVPWLGLPGNPVSSFVTFLLFGAPLVRRLQGRASCVPTPLPVPAAFRRPRAIARDEFLRVRVEDGRLVPHPRQGSGVLSSTSWSDGLARVPAGARVDEGDAVAYYGYADLLA